MRCIVTAGPTYEPLDEVRRLTNFSTGKLGSDLAGFLQGKGFRTTLLRGYNSTYQARIEVEETTTFTTTADLAARLERYSTGGIDLVCHAAAVSDFQFGKGFTADATGALAEIQERKWSTRAGRILVELIPTPKILPKLRAWFPNALIIGWKYEVDGARAQALKGGQRQFQESRTDFSVINGPAYGPGFCLLAKNGSEKHCLDAHELYETLWKNVTAHRESSN